MATGIGIDIYMHKRYEAINKETDTEISRDTDVNLDIGLFSHPHRFFTAGSPFRLNNIRALVETVRDQALLDFNC